MRIVSTLALTAAVLVPVASRAAAPLEGTWKTDMSTAKFGGKPQVIMLKDGVYTCGSCTPPSTYPADGKPHPVTNPYYETSTATVVPPREVDISHSKGGKVVATATITVSEDGNTATFKGSDSTATTGAPVEYHYTSKRVGTLPPGAAVVSGKWEATAADYSENAVTVTYKLAGDMLSMSSPTGQSFSAKIGGPEVPYVGDPGTSTVSIKKTGSSSYKETDYRNGKVIDVTTTTVEADGKTAKIVSVDMVNHQTASFVAKKQ